MPLIRWEEDPGYYPYEHEWLGYLGTRIICSIDKDNTLFVPITSERVTYNKLSHAKRGAETMVKRFLEDAGLEVTGKDFQLVSNSRNGKGGKL